MAIVVKDRVKVVSATTGTSDFILGGAPSGFQTFAAIGNNNYTYYAAVDPATGDWEVGYGQYTTAGPTLTRNTILSSSAAGAKISFGSGDKDVFCTYPSEKAIYEELTGNVLIDGGPLTVVGTGVTSYTSFGAALAEMYANETAYAQMYVQNLNTSPTASTDIVAYNDAGDGVNNFIDMGISSANYSDPTYEIFTAGSGYLFNDGGELIIGSATDDVVLFAGGVAAADEAVRIDKTSKEVTTASGLTLGGALTGVGGTFTAAVTTTSASATSPSNNEFVTKAYVDNATSTGIHIHTPVYAETSAALAAVYVQGGTTFNITNITGTNTVVTSTTHGLSVNDEIWLTTTAGNGLSINTAYFVYATPTGTSLQLSLNYNGVLLTGLTNASGLAYATRANSGVGSYLESSANATFTIGSYTLTVGDRILVYQQSTGYWNGVYTITSLGSGSSKWQLTRATDQNKFEPQDVNGIGEGDYFLVTTNSESYVLTTPGNLIIGYTSLTYTLFSSAPVYTGGTNIDISGGVISLTGTVAATNGGTGQNTVTTGDLLYGSASNTWSKLALGAAYKTLSVNGAGTQVEWNAVALDQSNAVSGTLPVGYGGTGITGYAQGEMLYANTTTTLDKVTANTTTTKKFLSQTGTGTAGQAPTWAQPAASDITGLAPSATTDTTDANNITSGTLGTSRLSGSYTGITGVGTLTAGTWNASTVAANYGGTGFASYAVGDLLYADTTTSLAKLADVAVGNALISGGVGSAPSWGKIGLATHVSGTLPIANGGTGSTSTTFVDLTTNVTGILPSANGGTGNGFTKFSGPTTAEKTFTLPNANATILTDNAVVTIAQGGTNSTATPTNGGIGYGTGTAHAYSTAGTSGQVLTSAGAAAPTWTTATDANTASAIVKRDASGNFTAGTITATLSGSATSVALTASNEVNVGGGLVSAGGTLYFNYNDGGNYGNLSIYGGGTTLATITASNITAAGNVTGNAASATTVAGIVQNSGTTYGNIACNTAKNGYYGYLMGTTTSHLQIMADGSGNGGFYREGSGWPLYYLASNASVGIMASTTSASYALYVTGAIYSTNNITAYSDRRAKKDIVTIDNALEKTNKLRGVYYKRIEEDVKDESQHDRLQMGVVAQEVLEVAPEVVTYDKDNDKYGVAYANMAGLFIEAIKELTDKVTTLEAKLEQLTKDKS